MYKCLSLFVFILVSAVSHSRHILVTHSPYQRGTRYWVEKVFLSKSASGKDNLQSIFKIPRANWYQVPDRASSKVLMSQISRAFSSLAKNKKSKITININSHGNKYGFSDGANRLFPYSVFAKGLAGLMKKFEIKNKNGLEVNIVFNVCYGGKLLGFLKQELKSQKIKTTKIRYFGSSSGSWPSYDNDILERLYYQGNLHLFANHKSNKLARASFSKDLFLKPAGLSRFIYWTNRPTRKKSVAINYQNIATAMLDSSRSSRLRINAIRFLSGAKGAEASYAISSLMKLLRRAYLIDKQRVGKSKLNPMMFNAKHMRPENTVLSGDLVYALGLLSHNPSFKKYKQSFSKMAIWFYRNAFRGDYRLSAAFGLYQMNGIKEAPKFVHLLFSRSIGHLMKKNIIDQFIQYGDNSIFQVLESMSSYGERSGMILRYVGGLIYTLKSKNSSSYLKFFKHSYPTPVRQMAFFGLMIANTDDGIKQFRLNWIKERNVRVKTIGLHYLKYSKRDAAFRFLKTVASGKYKDWRYQAAAMHSLMFYGAKGRVFVKAFGKTSKDLKLKHFVGSLFKRYPKL